MRTLLANQRVPSERQLLFQLRAEMRRDAPRSAASDQAQSDEQIHAELCELCRERMLADLVSSTKMRTASEEARAKVLALCRRESTRMGALLVRTHWAVRGLPVWLWARLPPSALHVPRVEAPSAERLFNEFVSQNRPCIITGALDAAAFPPLQTFRDDAYLRGRCGHRPVPVKGHYADGLVGGRRVFFNDAERRVAFAHYLDAVDAARTSGEPLALYLSRLPLGTHLPELAADVRAARAAPGSLYRACFGAPLDEGVVMYFGGGGNTTQTHFDAYEDLMLCVDGTKRLLLFPPGEADHLYVTRMGGKVRRRRTSRRTRSRACPAAARLWHGAFRL